MFGYFFVATEGELLRKLSTSLGKHKYNAESLPNLMVHVNEKRMIAWNDDDECLYVCTIVNRIVHVEQVSFCLVKHFELNLRFNFHFRFFSFLITLCLRWPI